MAYAFYLGTVRLPVAPAKLSTKVSGKNQTAALINDGEINILKQPGLTDISFSALLPSVNYPFASYDGGFKGAGFFLDELQRLMAAKAPFRFVVSHTAPGGQILPDFDMKVSLEDYKITEDAKNGFDISVDITLRQYRDYGAKTVEVIQPAAAETKSTAVAEVRRPVENPPTQPVYTVAAGDSLWAIAQKMLGDGGRYPEIYTLNQALMDERNKGTGNTKYTIYPGQALTMP